MKWLEIIESKKFIGGELRGLIGLDDYCGPISNIKQIGDFVVIDLAWLAIREYASGLNVPWKKFKGFDGKDLPNPLSALNQITLKFDELESFRESEEVICIYFSNLEVINLFPKDYEFKIKASEVIGLTQEERAICL